MADITVSGNYNGLDITVYLTEAVGGQQGYYRAFIDSDDNSLNGTIVDNHVIKDLVNNFLASQLANYNPNDYAPQQQSEHHFRAYGGDDHITSEFGIINCLLGGLGNDTLLGADYNDYLRGDVDNMWGNRNDLESTGNTGNNDILKGGAGNDLLGGDGGNDKLYGEEGNDRLHGGYGDDILHGGFSDGNDRLNGGTNSPTLTQDQKAMGMLVDTLAAGAERFYWGDTVTYEDYTSSPDANGNTQTVMAGMYGVRIRLLDNSDTSTGMTRQMKHGMSGHVGAGDELYGIENLVGTTSNNDRLVGNNHDNILEGLGGNDMLDGGGGSDTASYKSSDAGVTVDLSQSIGSGGHAEGDMLSNIENIIGSEHADTLTGDNGDNILIGLDGDDTFKGGGGGEDRFVGGAGIDTVDFSNEVDALMFNAYDADGVGTGMLGMDSFSLHGIENIKGTDDSDTIRGNDADNKLEGGLGIDTIYGGAGNDELHGGIGADVLSGGNGEDEYFFLYENGVATTDAIQGENGGTGNNKIIFDYSDKEQGDLTGLMFEFNRVDNNGDSNPDGDNLSIQAAIQLPGMININPNVPNVPSSFVIENYFSSMDGPGNFSIHLIYDGQMTNSYGTIDDILAQAIGSGLIEAFQP